MPESKSKEVLNEHIGDDLYTLTVWPIGQGQFEGVGNVFPNFDDKLPQTQESTVIWTQRASSADILTRNFKRHLREIRLHPPDSSP